MSKVLNKRIKTEGTEQKSVSEFLAVQFGSRKKDSFRVVVSSADSFGIKLWVESRHSKDQWDASFTTLEECGPRGFPMGAVLKSLQVIKITYLK